MQIPLFLRLTVKLIEAVKFRVKAVVLLKNLPVPKKFNPKGRW